MKKKNTPRKKQPVKKAFPQTQQPSPQQESQIVAVRGFSGPLPPPETLQQYEKVCRGSADRIITMAENQATHRHDLEKKQLQADIKLACKEANEIKLGQFLGFLIGIFTVAGGTYAATHGAQIPGVLIGSGGVIGLVTAFIYGRKGKNQ